MGEIAWYPGFAPPGFLGRLFQTCLLQAGRNDESGLP